jgi:hypothetical protein
MATRINRLGIACCLFIVSTSLAFSDDRLGLGSSRTAFQARFGPPVRGGAELTDFKKCPGRIALAEWSVTFRDDKAIAITRNACPPAVHQPSAAEVEAKSMFPADAILGKDFSTTDGWKARAYRSAQVGKALPRRAFEDCNGKLVPAGTFFYLLSPERKSWILGAGLCP